MTVADELLPNMSAKGFPSCNKSSEAFAFVLGIALASCTGASKRSTIGAELPAVGEARKGLVDGLTALGETTLDCYSY